MSFRIYLNGVVMETDSPSEALALIAATRAPAVAVKARPRVARPRGASVGALDGRILQAISEGITKPAAIVKAVKADKAAVRKCLRALEADGKVRAEGATISRQYRLGR